MFPPHVLLSCCWRLNWYWLLNVSELFRPTIFCSESVPKTYLQKSHTGIELAIAAVSLRARHRWCSSYSESACESAREFTIESTIAGWVETCALLLMQWLQRVGAQVGTYGAVAARTHRDRSCTMIGRPAVQQGIKDRVDSTAVHLWGGAAREDNMTGSQTNKRPIAERPIA